MMEQVFFSWDIYDHEKHKNYKDLVPMFIHGDLTIMV
jgi:hypothetical protein